MARGRVIIVGGGIGGLTMALAAQRAGFEAKVFERAARIEDVQVGSGITIWGTAMRVYRELGTMDAMVSKGGRVEWQDYFSWKGHKLGRGESGELARRSADAPNVSAPRGAFHGTLVDALAPGTIECGKTCTGFEQDSDSVTVEFDDGSSADGDALVGADGFQSVVRPRVLGEEGRRYRYTGLTSWNGIIEFDHEPSHLVQMTIWGPGSRFLFVHLGAGMVGWVAVARAPEGESDPPEGARSFLLDRFGDWMAPVPDMLRATHDGGIRRLDVVDRAPVSSWGSGRVTLLGDAAHPMTFFLGQGACSAIEDGFVLGRRMRLYGATPEALRSYEQARLDNANRIVEASWRLGKLVAVPGRAGSTVRNVGVRLASKAIHQHLIGRVDENSRHEDAAYAAMSAAQSRLSEPAPG